MDHRFVIDTIHERRAGIDMISLPYLEETVFADPDALREEEGDPEERGLGISRH